MRFVGILACFSLVVLSACQSTNTIQFTGPAGETIQTVKCQTSTTSCFQQAAAVCEGQPYSAIDSYSKAGGLLADIMPGPFTWYYMTFQCGVQDGQQPTFPFRGQSYAPTAAYVAPQNSTPQSTIPQSTTTTCFDLGTSISCRTR